ncbi:MAG TPA: hypothetical protein VK858_04815 [Longimicrobiales bacterium]|nr:hypothetical protein [Longimicrobiales bacterium]
MIVTSILLAFAIDAAWDERQEGVREQIALESLLAEFQANDSILNDAIQDHRESIERTLRLLRISSEGTVAAEVDGDLDGIVYDAMVGARTTNLSSGAIDALLSSGDIGLISDPRLKRMLAAWQGVVEEALEEENALTRTRDQVWIPFLLESVPLLTILRESSAAPLDGVGLGAGMPDGPDVDYGALLGSRRLEGILSLRIVQERVIVRDLMQTRDAAREIVARIRVELD